MPTLYDVWELAPSWREWWRFTPGELPANFHLRLKGITGRLNSRPFRGQPAGMCLLTGGAIKFDIEGDGSKITQVFYDFRLYSTPCPFDIYGEDDFTDLCIPQGARVAEIGVIGASKGDSGC